jgi:hypothetical protein
MAKRTKARRLVLSDSMDSYISMDVIRNGIEASEYRERVSQLKRVYRPRRHKTREEAEGALKALIANDRIGPDWCEVSEEMDLLLLI